ncbi:MAG: hypothetical protein SVW57_03025 [Thermodesulfobacteriota bacterium]|nr:hypothetical protein [Thermodesulfobacteriota bacterium]
MHQIDSLYEKLVIKDETQSTYKIDTKIRAKIYEIIMDEVDKLRGEQDNLNSESLEYKQLETEIRLRLLKEIQVIIDDYILAKKNGNLDKWHDMYGDINRYKEGFFNYRIK